jgi:hypothetical protein
MWQYFEGGKGELIAYHMAFENKIFVLSWKRFVPDGGSESSVVGY